MSWLSSFLHPEKGYEAGQNALDKYYQEGQGYTQPYNQYGQDAHAQLSEYLKNLMNPEALQSKWAEGYKESPYAKDEEARATEHGMNTASSMGLMGSSPAIQAIQAGTSQIGNQDRQQYLNDLMKKYLEGAGIAQNIFGTGANAANQMGQNAMNMGQNTAQMEFGKTNAPGDLFSKLLQGAVSMATPVAQGWGMKQLGVNNNPWNTYGGNNAH